MLCQQLQEKDGYDDFMDENIDLTPYLNDLQDLDGDLGEELLDKQRLIESDIYTQHCGYPPQYTDLATYEHKEQEQSFDDMASAAPATPQMSGRHLSVKVEAPWEDEATAPEQSLQPTTSSPGAKEQIEVTYTPTIKPRKYSLKPEVYIFRDFSFVGLLKYVLCGNRGCLSGLNSSLLFPLMVFFSGFVFKLAKLIRIVLLTLANLSTAFYICGGNKLNCMSIIGFSGGFSAH
uniref:BZIP domain-containing protein n=1 Tax=Parascaris univalens TaxID=6257 RepID=A0A915AHA1_PARUN